MPDWTYHPFFKPLLFRLPPEAARRVTLRMLEMQARTAVGRRVFRWFGHGLPPAALAVTAFGLRFPGPIGLGAGIDLAATTLPVMQHLGFGFVTVGPVGEQALPRTLAHDPLRLEDVFALVQSQSAGNDAMATLAARICAAPGLAVPVGIALRGEDLAAAIRAAGDAGSFFTVPAITTPAGLAELRAATAKPLLLRLSPDWSDGELDARVAAAREAGLSGGVAVDGVASPLLPGGQMDGPFLRRRALAVIERVASRHGDDFPIIGAGGVFSPEDALSHLDAGAKLVELYAGLVYAGPGLPGRIIHALEHRSAEVVTPAAPTPSPPSSSTTSLSPPTGPWGWQLISGVGAIIVAAGIFALVLAATVKLLPYDTAYLGMSVGSLCQMHACRIVHFMAHDRVSFGGSMIAIGLLYVWLGWSPLRRGEAWAFWTVIATGLVGFGSFLTYLGYGYLDVWHGRASVALLALYVVGLWRIWPTLARPRGPGSVFRGGARAWRWSPAGMGRLLLSFSAFGMIAGGATIMVVGMTRVFVPQDLEFIGMKASALAAINPRLVSLIAHDRAGFGGGLASGGIAVMMCVWRGARPGARGLWLALLLSGVIGFGAAIGVHPIVGYNSFSHLAPALAGALTFILGIAFLYRPMCRVDAGADRFPDL